MKVELILPIARLRGKINSKSPFYFKTVNGKTFVQHCPNRSTKAPTPAQTAAKQRFAGLLHLFQFPILPIDCICSRKAVLLCSSGTP